MGGKKFDGGGGTYRCRENHLTQRFMASVPEKTRIILLGEPPDTGDELLLYLIQELHISTESSSRIFVLRDIKECLLKLHNGAIAV